MKYVNGEIKANFCTHEGISFKGINIPLINMIGNLISVESIITFAGVSVGGTESSAPRDEKQNAEINTAGIRRK